MTPATKAIAANFFQCAEHEVAEKLEVLKQLLEAGPAAPAAPTPAGPSDSDFAELKSRVDQLEKTVSDMTTPEIADDAPKA